MLSAFPFSSREPETPVSTFHVSSKSHPMSVATPENATLIGSQTSCKLPPCGNGDDTYKWVGLRIRVPFPSGKRCVSRWNHTHDLRKKATGKQWLIH